jgi:hydrogenase maturation factor HypF (carbamoyltransferase family)
MTTCKVCQGEINDQTDDQYNADHTRIQCPDCGTWQEVEAQPTQYNEPDEPTKWYRKHYQQNLTASLTGSI